MIKYIVNGITNNMNINLENHIEFIIQNVVKLINKTLPSKDQYEKLILSYDTFNPDGSMIAQLVIVMPELGSDYNANYTNELETRFNNFVQSTNELLECIQE